MTDKIKGIEFEFQCDQNWGKLTTDNGFKFCQHCKTPVYDLTRLTQNEIDFLLKQNDNRICGTIFNDQLSNPYPTRTNQKLKFALATTATIAVLSSGTIIAQTIPPMQTEQHELQDTVTKNVVATVDTLDHTKCDDKYFSTTPRPNSKKPFLKIFRVRFYTTNKFPFIIARRRLMGRIRR
ncbi:MAG: hypothetical protein H0X63_10780 [Flavobacteriales bacterium]|nr:hypothetical protein [Flavobacteriales bacterium]